MLLTRSNECRESIRSLGQGGKNAQLLRRRAKELKNTPPSSRAPYQKKRNISSSVSILMIYYSRCRNTLKSLISLFQRECDAQIERELDRGGF